MEEHILKIVLGLAIACILKFRYSSEIYISTMREQMKGLSTKVDAIESKVKMLKSIK